MGFEDRDYYRNPPPGGGGMGGGVRRGGGGLPNFRTWSVTYWLIGINVAVFLLDGFLPLTQLGAFQTQAAILHGQVWRFITFQFLHANAQHIVFNMFALYLFGQLIESVLGPRRYLAFYLLSGVGGPLGMLLLEGAHIIPGSENSVLVGASAGIYGLLIACAIVVPTLRIIVLVFPMSIRTAAILATLYAVYSVLTAGSNFGGEAAHLGGGVVGFLLIKNIRVLNFLLPRQRDDMYIGPKSGFTPFKKDWGNDPDR